WDRVGHLMQGFVPAILARELLLRLTPLRRGGWLVYLVLAACLSFSALFELIEWWAALAFGADADAFLATQADVWDTQWDMFLCLCGAIASLRLCSRLHDRQRVPQGRAARRAPRDRWRSVSTRSSQARSRASLPPSAARSRSRRGPGTRRWPRAGWRPWPCPRAATARCRGNPAASWCPRAPPRGRRLPRRSRARRTWWR